MCQMAGKDNSITSRMRAALGVCVLVAGCVIQTGCDMPPGSPPTASHTMRDQERFLLSLVERNFQDPEAHYQLGEYYHTEGLWDKAEYHLDLALRFAPAYRNAQVALVRTLLDKGDRPAADQVVNRFSRQLSNSPQEMVDLAKALAGGGLDQYALACFNEATRASPSSALAFKELGCYWLGKNDTAKARQYLTRSFELDPIQPDVAEALGQMGVVVEVPHTPVDSGAEVSAQNPASPR